MAHENLQAGWDLVLTVHDGNQPMRNLGFRTTDPQAGFVTKTVGETAEAIEAVNADHALRNDATTRIEAKYEIAQAQTKKLEAHGETVGANYDKQILNLTTAAEATFVLPENAADVLRSFNDLPAAVEDGVVLPPGTTGFISKLEASLFVETLTDEQFAVLKSAPGRVFMTPMGPKMMPVIPASLVQDEILRRRPDASAKVHRLKELRGAYVGLTNMARELIRSSAGIRRGYYTDRWKGKLPAAGAVSVKR